MESSSEKAEAKKEQGSNPTDPDKKRIDWKWVRFIASVVTIIEIISYVLWQEADDFTGLVAVFIHWISKCGGLLGAAFIAHKIAEHRMKVWIAYAILCGVMLAIPMETLYRPKISSRQPEHTTQVVGWQPPELPPDSSNVVVYLGDMMFESQKFWAEAGPTNFVTKFPMKDLPPQIMNRIMNRIPAEKIPGYSPRVRTIALGVLLKARIDGMVIDSPVSPYVISNRFFVYVHIPFTSEMHIIVMSDDLDSDLSQLPKLWDRNYNSNMFEIVNESTNPVLQVLYKRPNEIRVNGIFIVDSSHAVVAFNNTPHIAIPAVASSNGQMTAAAAILSVGPNGQTVQGMEFGKFVDVFPIGTNRIDTHNITNMYNFSFPNQKVLFKYPSWKYPGVSE